MSEIYKKFGQALKLERENRNISLADLSDELKISEENLNQIENGEIDGLPSELYYNLFAKSYAKALGIDFNKTLDAIKEDLGETVETEGRDKADKKESARKSSPKVSKKPAEEPLSESAAATVWFKKKFITLLIAIIAVFIVFMTIYLIFIQEDSPAYKAENSPAVGSETPPDEAVNESKNDAAMENFQWRIPPNEAPVSFTMTLTAREECWVSLTADGDTAIFRNLIPWREYRVEAKYRMEITVAQPSLVEIKLNDKPVDLRSRDTRRISNLEINQANLDSFLNPPLEETVDEGGTEAATQKPTPKTTTDTNNQKPAETQVENEQI
ncbi:MAG: helix-turn-helix domain-containing protein [Candidatus Zixiibacteriota bacterium]